MWLFKVLCSGLCASKAARIVESPPAVPPVPAVATVEATHTVQETVYATVTATETVGIIATPVSFPSSTPTADFSGYEWDDGQTLTGLKPIYVKLKPNLIQRFFNRLPSPPSIPIPVYAITVFSQWLQEEFIHLAPIHIIYFAFWAIPIISFLWFLSERVHRDLIPEVLGNFRNALYAGACIPWLFVIILFDTMAGDLGLKDPLLVVNNRIQTFMIHPSIANPILRWICNRANMHRNLHRTVWEAIRFDVHPVFDGIADVQRCIFLGAIWLFPFILTLCTHLWTGFRTHVVPFVRRHFTAIRAIEGVQNTLIFFGFYFGGVITFFFLKPFVLPIWRIWERFQSPHMPTEEQKMFWEAERMTTADSLAILKRNKTLEKERLDYEDFFVKPLGQTAKRYRDTIHAALNDGNYYRRVVDIIANHALADSLEQTCSNPQNNALVPQHFNSARLHFEQAPNAAGLHIGLSQDRKQIQLNKETTSSGISSPTTLRIILRWRC